MTQIQLEPMGELVIEPVYVPAKLDIKNYEALKVRVDGLVRKYDGLVVTGDTTKSARKSQAELNAAINMIETFRKKVHGEYDEPYNAFKAKTDALEAELAKAKAPIKAALDVFAEQEKQKRIDTATAELSETLEARGLTEGDVALEKDWYGTSLSKMARLKQMAAAADAVVSERERIKTQKELVTLFAQANDVEPSGWLAQVDRGIALDDIKLGITQAVEERERRAEQARRKQEADEAIARMKQQQVAEKVIDTETGEVIDESSAQQPTPVDEVHEYTFRLVGTLAQANETAKHMRAMGYEFYSEGVK